MVNVVTGDDVERLIRRLLGGKLDSRPGKPPLDKRDIYLRFVKIERFYPRNGKVAVMPFSKLDDPTAQPVIIDVASPTPINDGGIISVATGETSKCPITGWDSIAPIECYGLMLSVEGDPYRKGAYLLGFTSLHDYRYEFEEPGTYIMFGKASIFLRRKDGKDCVEIKADEISINADKVTINDKEV